MDDYTATREPRMRPNLCRTIRIQITLAIALMASVSALGSVMARAAYAAAPAAPFVLGAPQLNQPSAVAVDQSSGETYVADTGNSAVASYAADGSFLGSFGTTLQASVGLSDPRGVAVDSNGDLFVADSGNNRIAEIDSSGFVANSWGWGVQDGASQLETCQTSYNTSVGPGGSSECMAGIAGSGAGELRNPTALAIDPADGDVYVADTGNGRIQEFDASGDYIRQFHTGSSFLPTGLAFDPTGTNLFVADANGNRLDEFTASGTFVGQFGDPTTVKNRPEGVAVDPATANVYVSDNDTSRIQEYSAGGTYLGQLGSPGSGLGQLEGPMQLGWSAVTDDVLVIDAGNSRVEAFDGTTPACAEAGATTGFNTSVTLEPDCTDPGQQVQRLQIVSLPTHGSVTVQNGQFTYEPDSGYSGSDTFTFEVVGADASAPATAAILVDGPPAPVCPSQSQTVSENTVTTLALNCTASGAPVAYELISGPEHGSLGAIDPATGAVSYTPSAGFTGPDQIVFDATDATGVSAQATLSLTVVAQQQSPGSPSSQPAAQAPSGSPMPAAGPQALSASQPAPVPSGGSARVALRSVICHSGARANVSCSVAFLGGGWIGSGSYRLSYSLSRNGKTVLAGAAATHNGVFRLQSARRLGPGRYTLSVVVSHNHQRILLSRAITVR